MLYELAHLIKDKCTFLWNAVEWGNAFLFVLKYKSKLIGVPQILESVSNDTFSIRKTEESDAKMLETFFAEQPESTFEFFKPHGFDEKSILKVLKNKAFQTFVVTEGDEIVGYFFLRSFINGKCFRGRITDYKLRGRGVGKMMARAFELVAVHEGLRMFASISPENLASLKSAKAVSDIRIIKTLENGYYYIECMPKLYKGKLGGVADNQLVMSVWTQVSNFKLAA
ncbi:MAG: GNAT family N-acetyltransferase [Bacteroides sp.]|nr:GNAT family N-acetyltransferase [Bacteroides sp.]